MKRARRLAAFRLPPELLDGLAFVKRRDGLAITGQVETAIRAWLRERGVTFDDLGRPILPKRRRRSRTG